MRSSPIWLLLTGALLLFNAHVGDAWNRQLYNRYSRNLFRNTGDPAGATGLGLGIGIGIGNELDELNALFGNGNGIDRAGGGAGGGGGRVVNGGGLLDSAQEQTEVYGIVEPLIEDLPCVNRPCGANDDCCPGGVCMKQYGAEAKCIYVYGHKRDVCHRNSDCEPGMACLKGAAGNFICQPLPLPLPIAGHGPGPMHAFTGLSREQSLEQARQYGEDCASSSDCNVAKGICCQLQRSHHRIMPKRMCAYFRDPFMCIDIMPTEDEEMRESRLLSSFSQKRI